MIVVLVPFTCAIVVTLAERAGGFCSGRVSAIV